ncbi:MAG: dCTP deaminase [Candidatus Diapherotrites archaeon CG10_big_fil_rev_8_21_14_0_10_31_34]|nr:MAG: dCTP deaminase [Candidatus Diapherotrites archaeon CG10_big_fil_rev_8_21_14_0_10_31_34]
MAVLSDRDLKKAIKEKDLEVSGIKMEEIFCSSIDLYLGNKFRVFKNSEISHIDVSKGVPENFTELIEIEDGKKFVVHPRELILAVTKEFIKIPNHLAGRLDGRSSLGRIGLLVHSTASAFDPGFEGNPTLEISNISKIPIIIRPGIKIARLTLDTLTSECDTPYSKKQGAKYFGNTGPENSKIEKD